MTVRRAHSSWLLLFGSLAASTGCVLGGIDVDPPSAQGGDGVGASSGTGASASGGAVAGGGEGGGVDAPDCDVDPGATCVAAAPPGWKGPGRFHYDLPGEDPGESCPAGYEPSPPLLSPTFSVTPTMCSGCECMSDCLVQPIRYNLAADCTGSQSGSVNQIKNMCVLADPESALGIQVAAPEAFCMTTVPTITAEPPVPAMIGRLCAAPDATSGCESGEVCVAPTAPPFSTSLCIWRAGLESCPAGFPSREVVYEGPYLDSRDCQCDCVFPSCTGFTELYAAACNDTVFGLVTHDETCFDVSGQGGIPFETRATVSAANCSVNDGPTGEVAVDPLAQLTVCCE